MNRFHFAACLVLALLPCLSMTGPLMAEDQVPFRGDLSGDFTVSPNPGLPPTATLVVSGTGNATQLGLFTFEIPHVVNFANMSATGTYHMTAANGDEIDGTFYGQSIPIGTDGAFVLVTEVVTITGGTGRFAGATGGFTTVRLVDRVNRQTIGSFRGSISHPGN